MLQNLKSPKFSSLLVASLLLVLIGCGGDKGTSSAPAADKLELQDDVDGIYRAHLVSLNQAYAGSTGGTITVRMRGDEIIVEGAIAGAPAGIKHYQFITTGQACPTAASDTNADGVVDAVEGASAYGPAIIPLDSNLNTQVDGSDFGPIANPAGAIVYRRSASVSNLMSDLFEMDPTPKDHLVKLVPGERMILNGKKVVLHGVSSELPATASGMNDLTAAESLPIACGILTRVSADEEPIDLPEVF